MTAPRHIVLRLLLALWLVAMVVSVVGYAVTEPTGDSFARGMNRVVIFFGWQVAGIVLALLCLFFRHEVTPGTPLRWISLVPIAVAGLLVAALAALFAYAWLGHP